MVLDVVTSADRPDLADEAAAFRQRWPEFVFHDPVPPRYMSRVHDYFGDLDVLLLIDGHVCAGGWGVTLAWDGTLADLPTGYDGALVRAVRDHEGGRRPTTLSLMAAAVHPDHDGQGHATAVLKALTDRATAAGIRTHQRMGARILGVATDSMVVTGTVAEWEDWSGRSFPTSGSYAVPDALNHLVVDRDADTATYAEENLWVQHR